VFYLAVGWLSRWQSLEMFAWTGRILSWGLLAVAFWRLCSALGIDGLYAPLAAALFVALNSRYRLAGEWVVGGFEAKGIAYAAVLWSLERCIRGRWNQALLAVGIAIAFHALVGGWSAIALGFVWLTQSSDRPRLRTLLPGLAMAAVVAAAGIVPSIALSWGSDANTVSLANRIYVYYRLPHHLVPWHFGSKAGMRAGLLLAAWLLLAWRFPADTALARVRGFVNGAILIAIIGLIAGLLTRQDPPLAAAILRYYWFRLSDVAVPLGVALFSVRLLLGQIRDPHVAAGADRSNSESRDRRFYLLATALVVFAVFSLATDVLQHARAARPPADAERRVADFAAWRDVCQWIAGHTESDALFLTPRLAQTFTWYSGRSAVVNAKDIPQDATSIVNWWLRLTDIHREELPTGQLAWRGTLAEAPLDQLARMSVKYDADYLLTEAQPRLALELVYSNNAYAVYRLPK
jgi:hypothetical protein